MKRILADEGNSSLTDYLRKAGHNLAGPVPDFVGLADELLLEIVGGLDENQHLTSARMMQMGFGSWRVSVALSLYGASSQVPIILRHVLECAMYAYLFSENKEAESIWWERELKPEAKSQMRGRTGPLAISKDLLRKQAPEVCRSVSQTLDTLIDFGAHPNMFQFVDGSEVEVGDNSNVYSTWLLGTEEARNSAFVMSTGVAMNFCSIFRIIWPIRFNSRSEEKLAELIGQARTFQNWHFSEPYGSKL